MTVKILLSKLEKKDTNCFLRGIKNIKQNNRIKITLKFVGRYTREKASHKYHKYVSFEAYFV